jgi:O-antigen/teichoic acid export membrane protein
MPVNLIETDVPNQEEAGGAFWSLADQATISAGNFLTGWFLARSLPAAEYGTWAVLLGAMVFANSIHAALVTSPLCVKGSSSTRWWARRFTGRSLIFAMRLAPLLILPLIVAATSLHRLAILPGVIGALVLWQFQETLRTGLISQFRFRAAIIGDAISYLGQAAGIVYCVQTGQSALLTVFVVMAATSVLAGLLQYRQLQICPHDFQPLEGYYGSSWSIGRWWFYARLAGVFSTLAFPWVLAVGKGPESTATFQALLTILGLINPALFSINSLVLTKVSRSNASSSDTLSIIRLALRASAAGITIIASYLVLVACFPHQIAAVFYGHSSPYVAHANLLQIFAIAYLMEAVSCVSLAILGGLQKTSLVFVTQCVAAALSLAFCLPAAYYWGVRSAVIGFAVVLAAKAVVSTFLVVQPAASDASDFDVRALRLTVK